jgi:hypothetical protein
MRSFLLCCVIAALSAAQCSAPQVTAPASPVSPSPTLKILFEQNMKPGMYVWDVPTPINVCVANAGGTGTDTPPTTDNRSS